MLECENGNYYTGYTDDLIKRYSNHKKGKAAKYTKSFRPIKISQCWKMSGTRGTAMKVEAFIKKKSRKDKDALVRYPSSLQKQAKEKLNIRIRIDICDPEIMEKKACQNAK